MKREESLIVIMFYILFIGVGFLVIINDFRGTYGWATLIYFSGLVGALLFTLPFSIYITFSGKSFKQVVLNIIGSSLPLTLLFLLVMMGPITDTIDEIFLSFKQGDILGSTIFIFFKHIFFTLLTLTSFFRIVYLIWKKGKK